MCILDLASWKSKMYVSSTAMATLTTCRYPGMGVHSPTPYRYYIVASSYLD